MFMSDTKWASTKLQSKNRYLTTFHWENTQDLWYHCLFLLRFILLFLIKSHTVVKVFLFLKWQSELCAFSSSVVFKCTAVSFFNILEMCYMCSRSGCCSMLTIMCHIHVLRSLSINAFKVLCLFYVSCRCVYLLVRLLFQNKMFLLFSCEKSLRNKVIECFLRKSCYVFYHMISVYS